MQGGGQIEKTVGGNILAQLVQRGAVKSAGQQRCTALRGGFSQQQIPGQGRKFTQYSAYILAPGVQLVQQQQRRLGIPVQNVPHELGSLQIACQTQHLQHRPAVHCAACGGALIQKAQTVSQSAVRQTAQQLGTVRRQVDVLLTGHIGQPLGDVSGENAFKRVALAPGENGGGHLVQLRGGQNEHEVGRRLL